MKYTRTKTGRRIRLALYVVVVMVLFFGLLEGTSRWLLKNNAVNSLEIWPMNPVFLIWDRIGEDPSVLDQLGAPHSVLRSLKVDRAENTLNVEEGNYYLRQQSVALERQPEHKRILFLGGSSVYGQSLPPEETIPNLVKKFLNEKSQENTVVVFNAGVPGATSTFCKRAMEEVSRLWKPDIIVIYSGHNDYLPFSEMYSPDMIPQTPPWNWIHNLLRRVSFIHLFAKMLHLESAQHEMVVRDFSNRFQFPGKDKWGQWETTAAEIDRRYEMNLMEITSLARQWGAQVLIASITSNLFTPPLVSVHGQDFSPGDSKIFNELLVQAEDAMQHDAPEDALPILDRLLEMDAHYARVHFLKGQILFHMGNTKQALESLRSARDIMTIRAGCTNAPTSIAERARQVGINESATLIDVERELWMQSEFQNNRELLFSDCLHFTSTGTAAVAGLVSDKILSEGWVR